MTVGRGGWAEAEQTLDLVPGLGGSVVRVVLTQADYLLGKEMSWSRACCDCPGFIPGCCKLVLQ